MMLAYRIAVVLLLAVIAASSASVAVRGVSVDGKVAAEASVTSPVQVRGVDFRPVEVTITDR